MKEIELKLKMLKLFSKLIFKPNLTYGEVKNTYIEYLKLSVLLGEEVPSFYESNKYENVNCYCYALGLSLPRVFYDAYMYTGVEKVSHNLGFISNKKYIHNKLNMIENLYEDLTALNINWNETSLYENNKYGGYKIALYMSDDDFHFLRENKDGLWSGKVGYTKNRLLVEANEKYKEYDLIKVLEIVKPRLK